MKTKPKHIITKLWANNYENIIKASRQQRQIMDKRTKIRMTPGISSEPLQARKKFYIQQKCPSLMKVN